MSTQPYLIRCMGGRFCRHKPGTCTADPEYQAEIALSNELLRVRATDMDLRDWFAGHALAGWLAGDEPGKRSYPQEAAYEAYQYADAMLAARAEKSS